MLSFAELLLGVGVAEDGASEDYIHMKPGATPTTLDEYLDMSPGTPRGTGTLIFLLCDRYCIFIGK